MLCVSLAVVAFASRLARCESRLSDNNDDDDADDGADDDGANADADGVDANGNGSVVAMSGWVTAVVIGCDGDESPSRNLAK